MVIIGKVKHVILAARTNKFPERQTDQFAIGAYACW